MFFWRLLSLLSALGLSACIFPPSAPIFEEEIPPLAPQKSAANFALGIEQANRAVELSQSAESIKDWEQIVQFWSLAAESMENVPDNDPKRLIAQRRSATYRENQAYAEQNVTRLEAKHKAERIE